MIYEINKTKYNATRVHGIVTAPAYFIAVPGYQGAYFCYVDYLLSYGPLACIS